MNRKVLIVEDEAHIGIGIKFNCEAEGLDATLVEDGPSALKLLADDPQAVDSMILYVTPPELNGYTVLATLPGQGNDTPVLILTATPLP